MKIMTIEISEKDYFNLDFNNEPVSFSEIQEKIKNNIIKDTLKKCRKIAQDTGLSEMSSDEINSEIKQMRLEKNS